MLLDKYTVAVFESVQDWEVLHEEWNTLLEKSKSNNVFLTFEWLHSWWNIYSNDRKKLFIVVVYNDNKIIGIAPWYIHNVKYGPFNYNRLEFIGSKEAGSDYLDVICMDGEEINVSNTVYKYINEVFKEWDSYYFYDFPAKSMFFMNFILNLNKDGKYYALNAASYCPTLNLPNNIEEYRSSLTAKKQKKIDWQIKRLAQKGNITIDNIVCNGIDSHIDDYLNFYEKVRNINRNKLRIFIKRYNKCVGNKSDIQLITIRQGDDVLASIMHLLYGKIKYNYLVATNKSYDNKLSIGEVLIYECINSSINEKFIKYDFLKGEEPYKFKWSNDGERSLSLIHYKFGFITFCLLLVENIKNLAKYILR